MKSSFSFNLICVRYSSAMKFILFILVSPPTNTTMIMFTCCRDFFFFMGEEDYRHFNLKNCNNVRNVRIYFKWVLKLLMDIRISSLVE